MAPRSVSGLSADLCTMPNNLLAAFNPSIPLESGGGPEISRLVPWPLLVVDTELRVWSSFRSGCRLAGSQPRIALESRAPHVLLAPAASGHGVAIIPSAMRTDQYGLMISFEPPTPEKASTSWSMATASECGSRCALPDARHLHRHPTGRLTSPCAVWAGRGSRTL